MLRCVSSVYDKVIVFLLERRMFLQEMLTVVNDKMLQFESICLQ